ncbi:MAG TPA: hypothetical protein VJB87_05010 [Candidatus Nanoarchaeia archaeon]|nr:hypothetical protein [Candidatus Nanoarchaeia archaeon]
MRKSVGIPIVLFFLGLVIFSLLSTKVLVTDAPQYVNAAKEFANLAVSPVRNFNAWLYPWLLGQVLQVVPSLVALKVVNVLWLVLDVLLLWLLVKRREVLWLFMFSPVVWVFSLWINPIIPVSFFLLLAYFSLVRFESSKSSYRWWWFVLSGVSLGLVSSLWWPGTYLAVFFILVFFWRSSFVAVIKYLACFGIGFAVRLVLDGVFFGFPFYSMIRALGSNVLFFLDKAEVLGAVPVPLWLVIFLVLVTISPFLFCLYRVDRQRYGRELVFLGLSSVLFLLNHDLRYFITIVPVVMVLLVSCVKRQDVVLHVALSLIILVPLAAPYFGVTDDYLLKQDVIQVVHDYPDRIFIVGTEGVSEEQAMDLSTVYWGSGIRFVTYKDWELSRDDEEMYREYVFVADPKINELRQLRFSLVYERGNNEDLDDLKDLLVIGDAPPPEGFVLVKKYALVRYYTLS